MTNDILLIALNAAYHHSAFGLRCLYANLEELQSRARILEFAVQKDPKDIVEEILATSPKIAALGVYIWNAPQMLEVARLLKRIAPQIKVVLGGPEVSHEWESQEIFRVADHLIRGEGEILFRELCRTILDEQQPEKILGPVQPDLASLRSPYPFYTDTDIRQRVIAVEASRGCPFRCEYCLSSLDGAVRAFPLVPFLAEMQSLLDRGARIFKFIDRTFNLDIRVCVQILEFFLQHAAKGIFLHFEMVPDRLPEELRSLIKAFPPGSLQFEIGIQTWNPEVARRIHRQNDYDKVRDNFRFLKEETGVHIHADLILGLPGESLESFAEGFDTLFRLQPHEIQLGILKRLRGTPITRHDKECGMVYSPSVPYQLLCNGLIDFSQMQQMCRFAKYWEIFVNSGNFKHAMSLVFRQANLREDDSIFWQFFDLSLFMAQRHPSKDGIALIHATESLWRYLTEKLALDESEVTQAIIQDYTIEGRRDVPQFLRQRPGAAVNLTKSSHNPLKRQAKHQ